MCETEYKQSEIMYSDGAPYPPVTVNEKNLSYARYLLDNIGGRNSEMTAISLYLFQKQKCSEYKEISKAFHKIAIVEMHHFDLFSGLCMKLGETPLMWTNCGRKKVWWSPSYADYPGELKKILTVAAEGEMSAIEKYRNQIQLIDDPYIQAILHRIIKDEELHVELFGQFYEKFC